MNQDVETIVILTPAFPKNESESSWVPSQQLLVKNLKSQFPDLKIVVLSFLYPYEKGEYDWHEVKVIAFAGMYKKGLRHLLLWRNIWIELTKAKNKGKVIGILSFWCNECAFIGKWFAHYHNLKHFCWICGQDAGRLNKYVKWIRPKSGELVAISDFVSEEFARNHKIKPRYTISNAVDKTLFPKESRLPRDIDILAAGSLIPLKQYDILVDVVAALVPSFPNIKVIHCGDGIEKEKLQILINKYGVENNIRLLGSIKHEELLLLMQRTKILLHPSRYEGFSTVCLEALYGGSQVISFCYPLEYPVQNWHVAKNKEHMIERASDILKTSGLEYAPVKLFSMDETAKAFVKLFEN